SLLPVVGNLVPPGLRVASEDPEWLREARERCGLRAAHRLRPDLLLLVLFRRGACARSQQFAQPALQESARMILSAAPVPLAPSFRLILLLCRLKKLSAPGRTFV